MIVSYSGYSESSVSCQFSAKETSNTNKSKLLAQSFRPIEHSFRKELHQKIQTYNRRPCQFLNETDKENDAFFEVSNTEVNIKQIYNYTLSNDSNSLDPYTEILGSVLEQKKNFDDVTDESHLFDKLHFVWQENLQWFYS